MKTLGSLLHRRRRSARSRRRDEGFVLPSAIVLSVTLALVASAVAGYAAVSLRYTVVVDQRADRLAAAEGGMRYAIEKMKLFQTLCTTGAANGDLSTAVPPVLNGANVTVTCRRMGTGAADIRGWAAVVTGAGLGAGGKGLISRGSNSTPKTFGGPVYLFSQNGLDLNAPIEIKNGDLWFKAGSCTPTPVISDSDLRFTPAFLRGPLCTTLTWKDLFPTSPPLPPMPTAVNPPFNDTFVPGCRVFFPGKYTTAPNLASDNYFVSGDYYFENVNFEVKQAQVVGGQSGGPAYGDTPYIHSPDCSDAPRTSRDVYDAEAANGYFGVTFVLGGSSKIYIDTQGEMELFRRRQGNGVVSVIAVDSENATGGYLPSTHTATGSEWLIDSKSGNGQDLVLHGQVYAPYGKVRLNNITNSANGQMLGGVVSAVLDVQASASASNFLIRVETDPTTFKLLLVSSATDSRGGVTRVRTVVDMNPDSGALAVNSWRVE